VFLRLPEAAGAGTFVGCPGSDQQCQQYLHLPDCPINGFPSDFSARAAKYI
jgi:hypothetical protein